MARIVVNRHHNNSRDVNINDFENYGQIVVSNEPGYEGLYIKNTNGDIIQFVPSNGSGAGIESDVKDFLRENYYSINDIKSIYFTSAHTIELIQALSASVMTAIEKGGDNNVQSDWDENDETSDSYIKNKPDIQSIAALEIAKIVDGADEKFDTLKEIADWIISDETNVTELLNNVQGLLSISASTRIDELEKQIVSANTRIDILETELSNIVKNGDHIVLNSEQYAELIEAGFTVVDGTLINYNDDFFYCIYEEDNTKPTQGNISVSGDSLIISDFIVDNDILTIPNAIIEGNVLIVGGDTERPSVDSDTIIEDNKAIFSNARIDEDNHILTLDNILIDENNNILEYNI